jgi:hypothetical protein
MTEITPLIMAMKWEKDYAVVTAQLSFNINSVGGWPGGSRTSVQTSGGMEKFRPAAQISLLTIRSQ